MQPMTWLFLMWISVQPMGNGNCYYSPTVNDKPATSDRFSEWPTKSSCEWALDEQKKEDAKSNCKIDDKRWLPRYMCIEVPKTN